MIKDGLIIVAGVYVFVLLAAVIFQRSLLYLPDRSLCLPAAAGLASVVERRIKTPDGETLLVWHAPAKPGRPTILYFHGNAGHLADRAPRIVRFAAEGYGVYMMAYRSYSGSTGAPTQANNRADALLAYHDLVAAGVPAGSIVAYGESLGTHMAAHVAVARAVAGLVLDAPYTSIAEVAALRFWFLPVRTLLRDQYDTAAMIDRLRVPLLVIHGVRDAVIPVAMGREILRRASGPKRMVEFANGQHSDLYLAGNEAIGPVREFVDGLAAASPVSRGSTAGR